ncbi:FG-GAP repeat domain-containing protein [Paraglaciecola marina]|uniref:FG-GAP repeat domain-containing protein n=1 Tax=Paraglaciecola marina TaxID=2500157 RepID=UPI00105D6B3E|nr:VCBS repeat-containing protein [Paraglaciecola marina]
MSKFTLPSIVFVTLLWTFAWPSYAKYTELFKQQVIPLDITVTQPVLAADVLNDEGVELIVVGVDELQQRTLLILKLDPETHQYLTHESVTIDPKVFAYDVGDPDHTGLQSIYFLSKHLVTRYIPAHMSHPSRILEEEQVSSLYLVNIADVFIHQNFIQDINDDGLNDIVLQSFESLNLWLSDCCGLRHPQKLPIDSRIEMEEGRVSFYENKLFFEDMNFDAKTDLIIVEQGNLKVFQQQPDMQFSVKPILIPLAQTIHGLNWWDMKGPNGRDLNQSNLEHRTVKEVTDLNGDGIPDLAVQFTQSSGVLDKNIEFEFYFGQKQQKLQYSEEAETSVEWDETLSGLAFVDLEGDGIQEVFVSSFDIGISQIIGALLSGGIDQDVLLFAMGENGEYSEKPLVSQEVEMTFSLSQGATGEPLIKVVDINGDNVKDLLFSDGDSAIRVLFATPDGKKPYARRSLRQKMIMPQNASSIDSVDLNKDGKSDLVIHYGQLDAEELHKQIVVLLAK